MDVSFKGPYTVVEQDDLMVTADITKSGHDIIEVLVFVPALNGWYGFNSETALNRAGELIEKYKSDNKDKCPVEHNFKRFA